MIRRSFLRSALAAPFVARLGVLMPVRSIVPASPADLADLAKGIDPGDVTLDLATRMFWIGWDA